MDLLSAVQGVLVDEQAKAALATQVACPECGRPRRHKDSRTIVVRSLFGTLRLASPRWWHCGCQPQAGRTFSPLAAVLPTRVTPELQYLEAKFAGLVSYGLSATLLAELLPLGRPLHATAVRHHVQAVAQRLEDELGPEQFSFIEGCPRDWAELPRPDLPLVVGLDGGESGKNRGRQVRRLEPGDLRTPTFDAIAAATAAPRPDPPALVRGRPSYRLPTVFPGLPRWPGLSAPFKPS